MHSAAPRSTARARIAVTLGTIALLTMLAFLTRWGSLAREVIDWDESTFILVAADILRGGLPYVATLDNKPPLQPFLLAGAMALMGESLATVRLLGLVALVATAAALAAMARPLVGAGAALLIGALTVAAASLWPFQPTMTQNVALGLLLPGLWLLSGAAPRLSAVFGAGVLVMSAVLCRSNLAVVALALVVFLAWPPDRAGLRRAAVFAAGLALPLTTIAALYAATGQFDRLMLGLVHMPAAYAAGQTPAPILLVVVIGGWLDRAITFPLIWGALTVAAVTGLALRRRHDDNAARNTDRLMLWAGVAMLVSMAMSGAFYRHHLLQLVPFAVWAVVRALAWAGPRVRVAVHLLSALAVAAALALWAPASLRLVAAPDWAAGHPLRQLAAEIALDRAPGDRVLAFDGILIQWYLGDTPLLPLAVHPSNLVRESLVEVLERAGEIGPDPVADLLAMRPRYIVVPLDLPWYLADLPEGALLDEVLDRDYDVWRLEGDYRVMRRR